MAIEEQKRLDQARRSVTNLKAFVEIVDMEYQTTLRRGKAAEVHKAESATRRTGERCAENLQYDDGEARRMKRANSIASKLRHITNTS